MPDAVVLGDAFAAKGDYVQAHSQYMLASPSVPGNLERLCHVTSLLGRTDEALACTQRAIALRPGVAFFHALEGELAGGADRAASAYLRARRLDPRDVKHASNHAASLRAAGRFAEAADAGRAALSLSPSSWEEYSSLAQALERLGKPTAIDYKAQAHALCRLQADTTRCVAPGIDLGASLVEAGRAAEALHVLRARVLHSPSFGRAPAVPPAAAAAAYFNLAKAHTALRRPCEAQGALAAARASGVSPTALLLDSDSDFDHAFGVAASRCAAGAPRPAAPGGARSGSSPGAATR